MNQIDGNSCDEGLEAYSKKMQMSRCASDVLFEWPTLVVRRKTTEIGKL
jgi:hypothetical protein